MSWEIEFHDDYSNEFDELPQAVQIELLALLELLASEGPELSRPHADTLKGSKHANMKELRFTVSGGVWRVAFAFDPARRAILLVGGNKSGVKEKRFYKVLIKTADARFDAHIEDLKNDSQPKGQIG